MGRPAILKKPVSVEQFLPLIANGEPYELVHVPQWACEVVSPGNSRVDWVRKQRALHAHQVPHYWLLDPREETLTVLRYHPDAYLVVLTAQRGETLRAEPFGDIEIEMDELLGLT